MCVWGGGGLFLKISFCLVEISLGVEFQPLMMPRTQITYTIPNTITVNTRQEKEKFCPVYAKHKRFLTNPISYLTKLLNDDRI